MEVKLVHISQDYYTPTFKSYWL